MASFSNAGATEDFFYDTDGLLTGAGPFTISRNPDDGHGEISAQTFTVNGSALGAWSVNRDNSGRITRKTETVDGVTTVYDYTYDSLGRLLSVSRDNVTVESCQQTR